MAPALGAVAGLLHHGFVHRGAGTAAWAAVGVTLVTFGVFQQPLAPPVPPGEVALEVVTANGRTEAVRGVVVRSPPPPRSAETLAAIALVVGFACNLVALFAVAATWDLHRSPQDTALLLLVML